MIQSLWAFVAANAAFSVASVVAIVATALTVTGRNPVHALLYLIVSLLAIALIFFVMGAPFAALLEVIVYAGAIMVLFLFVVMLLNAPQEDAAEWDRAHPFRRSGVGRFGALLAGLLVVQLAWALMRIVELDAPVGSQTDAATVSSVRELGRVLFDRHAFAFEATSILILVAMVGAVVLARREGES
jgi:NADH-quinone oxidoreductase subunit J